MTGSNLPDGLGASSPSAPWNAPDAWEGMACGSCRFACRLGRDMVCAFEPMDGCGDILHRTAAHAAACESFEPWEVR